ncbi:MAG: hypothetical protein CMM29_04925, partial [Rhodospirillaceae bacterium]|nr:hypothetical protein [Rhodospirillaceae bacterium]
KGFLQICQEFGEIPVSAVATSAVREAENQDEFLNRILKDLGLEVQVIPWEKEASLTLEGVFWKISPTQPYPTHSIYFREGSKHNYIIILFS